MNFNLTKATFIKRYKRFLVDVKLGEEIVTIHCPNTGSMQGCLQSQGKVYLSTSDNSTRKYIHTLEVTKVNDALIGVNTHNANKLVLEAINNKVIKFKHEVKSVKPEVKLADSNSRLDFLVQGENQQQTYVEVKNTTLFEDGFAQFPDSVTTRGQKHLDELLLLQKTYNTMLIFCVQHTKAKQFKPSSIDPVYAQKLAKCQAAGVDIRAFVATIDLTNITLTHEIPVLI